MHDSISKMSGSIDSMRDSIHDVKSDADVLYFDLRAAQARDARQNALAAMNASNDIGTKIGFATEYLASLEYQSWKPMLETDRGRQALMSEAVQEFFLKIRQFISDRSDVSPSSNANMAQNLYALAAGIQFVSQTQIDALNGTSKVQVSMLSMIEDGINAKKGVSDGTLSLSSLPDYQAQVLIQEQDAIYFLRVRQNFLKAFAFVLAASDSEGDAPGTLMLFWDYIRSNIFNGSWTPNFSSRNILQIQFNAGALEFATETETFLRTHGYDPMNDKKISVFLNHLNLDPFNIPALLLSTDPADRLRGQSLKRFQDALNAVTRVD